METDIINVSSRGQVVIPQAIRKKLKIKEGQKLLVTRQDDVVLMKKLDFEDFDRIVKKIRKDVKKANITPEDVKAAIKEVRDAESSNRH